ncbi:hypothetical protein [Brachybacterium squillarum]|uniref:hypothetical protein n=1 Tax=Brachybacterium squillarum TaxID=661979 RepID=UPI0022212D93|nr:hypothetical protein [Brachybacterium squillarum]MCW1805280.1 hypothetical protein [Brachybacterium squillarum]
MARRVVATRPARPSPYCEDCGGDVWWAWGIHGKKWTPLHPERYPLDGTYGTYEAWQDAHGGLLCRHLPPGERGVQDRSWRAAHHNAACGRWRTEATAGLVRESLAAVPAMTDGDLLALGHRLRDVQAAISHEIRSRALSATDEE